MDHVINNNLMRIFSTTSELFQAAAENFIELAKATIPIKNEFTVVLSGGNTAKYFFDALSLQAPSSSLRAKRSNPEWHKIKFFFGDERYVPPDDTESNYHTAQEHLFSKISIPEENIYRIPTELNDPKAAAFQYESTLRKVFSLKKDEFPKFDLIYLGLGEDGHTASLMPVHTSLRLRAQRRGSNPESSDNLDCFASLAMTEKALATSEIVTSLWVEKLNMFRITLTPNAINQSRCICFLVTGANKAAAVKQTLEGSFNPQQYPAQLIQCHDQRNIWYLDEKAAAELT